MSSDSISVSSNEILNHNTKSVISLSNPEGFTEEVVLIHPNFTDKVLLNLELWDDCGIKALKVLSSIKVKSLPITKVKVLSRKLKKIN